MVRYSGMVMAYLDKYVIYSSTCKNSSNINSYYIAIPQKDYDGYSLCVGLPDKHVDFALKDSILEEFNDNLEKIDSEKIIYALPVVPRGLVINEDNQNDDKVYQELSQSLLSMMADIFDEMIENNHKQMEQKVFLVVKNEAQKKFFDWMDMKKPGLFQEIWLNNRKLEELSVNNNLMNDEMIGTGNSGNALSGGLTTSSYEVSKPKVKVLVSPSKHGFSTITGLFLTIVMSLFLGISLAIMIVK